LKRIETKVKEAGPARILKEPAFFWKKESLAKKTSMGQAPPSFLPLPWPRHGKAKA
jgi:hypothetical protein